MYQNNESYFVIKDILLKSIPLNITLKQKTESEILLVTTKEYSLHFLNGVAKDFLLLCDGNRTLKNILNILFSNYDIDKETLTNDMIDLIQDLQTKRIIYIKSNYYG